jgi:hypothetical protein
MSTNKRLIDPAIVAALIGVMGTICVTVITLSYNRIVPPQTPAPQPSALQPSTPQPTTLESSPSPLPTWTVSPTATLTETPVPTDTVPAGEPSSTPAPDTPIPGPTSTLAPPAIGSDWANGCISVQWRPYPDSIQTTSNNGCLAEPVSVFFAADGRLTFDVSGRSEDRQIFGLFAPLPASGKVSISTYVSNLQEGEIWMGVFAQPNIESQGIVIVIPSGRERRLIQRTMPDGTDLGNTEPQPQVPPLYDAVFEFSNGQVTAKAMRESITFDAVPVDSAQKWFFVGYQFRGNNERTEIDAEFLNLVLQGQ